MSQNDYFLYVGQEANFQSRSMLIPIDKMTKEIKEMINQVKKSSFTLEENKNIIIINYSRVCSEDYENCAENSRICNLLNNYADGSFPDFDDEETGEHYICYPHDNDKEWVDHTFYNVTKGGFNHLKNYLTCLKMTRYKNNPINIVDSLLMLTSCDGKLNKSKWDTTSEMMRDLYPHVSI